MGDEGANEYKAGVHASWWVGGCKCLVVCQFMEDYGGELNYMVLHCDERKHHVVYTPFVTVQHKQLAGKNKPTLPRIRCRVAKRASAVDSTITHACYFPPPGQQQLPGHGHSYCHNNPVRMTRMTLY